MSDSLRPHGLQHSRLPCPSSTPRDCSNSYPLSQWCHPTISSFVVPFSCLQSFPTSGSFPVSQFFTSGGQSMELQLQHQSFQWIFRVDFLSVSSVQLFSHVQHFVTPWKAARQASLFITNSQSLLKLISIESVMPSNHLILCYPLLLLPSIFPSIRVFSHESALHIRWPSIGASSSASVLPMNIQDWFSLGLTGLISLLSSGLSRVFNTAVQNHQFFGSKPSLWSNSQIHTWLLEKP